MRSRLLAPMSALALTLGGLLVSAGPAGAEPAHCSWWNNSIRDLYTAGDIHFKDGAPIRTGAFSDCNIVGYGYPSHGIDIHCRVKNDQNANWIHLRDTTTGAVGWARTDTLSGYPASVPNCFS